MRVTPPGTAPENGPGGVPKRQARLSNATNPPADVADPRETSNRVEVQRVGRAMTTTLLR